jgi:DNA modification methylase
MIKFINNNFFQPHPRIAKSLLKLHNKVDLILTDPPFNIAEKGKVTKAHGKLWSNAEAWGDVFKDEFTEEEYDEFIKQFLRRAFVLLKPGGSLVTFIDDKYAGVLIRFAERINEGKEDQPRGFAHKRNIHFAKTNCMPRIRMFNYSPACEVAVWLVKPHLKGTSKTKPAIFNYLKPRKGLKHPDGEHNVREYHNTSSSNVFLYTIGGGAKRTGHPCEKVTEVLTPLIKAHSNEGSLVLDPFFGGGNVGLCCHELKRHFLGFDIDKRWHSWAVELFKELMATGTCKETKRRIMKTLKAEREEKKGAKKEKNEE